MGPDPIIISSERAAAKGWQTFWRRVRPAFLNEPEPVAGQHRPLLNFQRIWKLAIWLTASAAILPLVAITLIDYNVTQRAIASEILLRTSRTVSNTWRTVSFFLTERRAAIDFIVQHYSCAQLDDPQRLTMILSDLQKTFGGFADLGLVDGQGRQLTYVGPYALVGKDYSEQAWFREARERGVHISDMFLGYRNTPHMVIAVRGQNPDGSFFILRAALEIERFNDLLRQIELDGRGDAFIVNRNGRLQTPSRFHGNVLDTLPLPVPEFSPKTVVYESADEAGHGLIVGYVYIPETPFVLMIVKRKAELMRSWHMTRLELIGFLAASITIILLVIISVATFLVGKIYLADRQRVMSLHQVEYANKLASIGRLAAGVAHEINNPLAIINEKAGLIKDLLTFQRNTGPDDARLPALLDAILVSVGRCATITRRLLGFARHMDVSIEPVRLVEIIGEVLGFLGKEAEYRSIVVALNISPEIPEFESDRGKLQQIFLNLFNNAFAAMKDGGRLEILARPESPPDGVLIRVGDNGCGIAPQDLRRVFEPFFSTKARSGGTGLGLSITYGLVRELGGRIEVESNLGEGTTFTLHLPYHPPSRVKEGDHARPAG